MSRTVQSLERGLLVLEALAKDSPRGTTELAAELGLDKTIVHRLLTTLQALGYAQQDENRKYMVGMKLRHIGAQVLSTLDLRTLAQPYMQELADFTSGVAHLATLAEDRAIYIEKVQHPSLPLKTTDVGGEAPGYCTAAGKTLWAHLSTSDLAAIVDKTTMRQHTPKTLTDFSQLNAQLAMIRSRGYAVDDEEHRLGLIGIGAPVFDHMGNVIASICVGGFADQMDADMRGQVQTQVVRVGKALSQEMGYGKGDI